MLNFKLKKLRLLASFALLVSSHMTYANDAIIYDYLIDNGTLGADNAGSTGLSERLTSAGYNPTIVDFSSGAYLSYNFPQSLLNYSQVWDLGAQPALTSNQISVFTNYVTNGGSLFLMGEHGGYGPDRNSSIASFLTTLGGGNVTTNSNVTFQLTSVDPEFQIQNNSSSVYFPAVGQFSSVGLGTCIDSSCGAAAWDFNVITNGVIKGTVISVLDVNFLMKRYWQSNDQNSLGYLTQEFTDNLIAYLTQQAISSGLIQGQGSGPNAADTQASLSPNAYALRGAFAGQSALINVGLSYDCTTFDAKGICVSAGGRVTDTNNPATNTQGALLIASYRANEQWRIGGYLDQNLSSNDARGVNLDNNNPMGGLFAVWNQKIDGTGYQVRLAAGYSDKDMTISRSAFGTAEAGRGDSSLQSQAYSVTLSRGFQINDSRWIASPYLGVRYTKIKRAGYTEEGSADVVAPLSYSALSQETTTALLGVRFNGRVGDKINLMASAGIENDIAHNTGDYTATGVDGLTPFGFNQNIRHVRPVASAGASYSIDKRQTIGMNLNYRQEAFNAINSVSGMVNYQIGF